MYATSGPNIQIHQLVCFPLIFNIIRVCVCAARNSSWQRHIWPRPLNFVAGSETGFNAVSCASVQLKLSLYQGFFSKTLKQYLTRRHHKYFYLVFFTYYVFQLDTTKLTKFGRILQHILVSNWRTRWWYKPRDPGWVTKWLMLPSVIRYYNQMYYSWWKSAAISTGLRSLGHTRDVAQTKSCSGCVGNSSSSSINFRGGTTVQSMTAAVHLLD